MITLKNIEEQESDNENDDLSDFVINDDEPLEFYDDEENSFEPEFP